MALATTCPQCKTSFKVVPDQLKLRRGLVRCGVCQHVFSGVEHLRYVDKDEKTEKATPAVGAPSAPAPPVDAPAPRPAAPAVPPRSDSMGTTVTPPVSPSRQPTGTGTQPLDRLPPEQVLSVTEVPDLSMPDELDAAADVAAPAPEAEVRSPEEGQAPEAAQATEDAHHASDDAPDVDGNGTDSADTPSGDGQDDLPADGDAEADPDSPTETRRHDDAGPRNSRSKRRWRRERERERVRQAEASATAQADEAVHTQFFMSEHEADAASGGQPDSNRLPASLRQHADKADQDDQDPDTLAAGALINEANKIWRQHQPRQSQDATQTHDNPSRSQKTRQGAAASPAVIETATDEPAPLDKGIQTDGTSEPGGTRTRWLTPARSRRLIIGLIVLAIIQLLAVFRTEIAYRLPFLRPLASVASTLTGQTIEAPMALDSLSIESFELRGTNQPGQTRLTAILRNRSALPARWPAMELTLTGPSNAVLVRKVMMPAHYLPVTQSIQDGIAARSEQPLDLLLDTGELNLAGYSVSLFYP